MLFRVALILQLLCFAAVPLSAQYSPTDPIYIGRWETLFNWPVVAIHAYVMPDGRVVTWGAQRPDPENRRVYLQPCQWVQYLVVAE